MLKPHFAASRGDFCGSSYHYIRQKRGLGFHSFQPPHFQQFFGTKYGNENFVGLGRKPIQPHPFVIHFFSSHL